MLGTMGINLAAYRTESQWNTHHTDAAHFHFALRKLMIEQNAFCLTQVSQTFHSVNFKVRANWLFLACKASPSSLTTYSIFMMIMHFNKSERQKTDKTDIPHCFAIESLITLG